MKKILLVSADGQFLTQLKEGLTQKGFEVDELAGHEHLFSRIKDIRPEVLVIDFIMEDENAAALCHKLKSDDATRGLQIIMLSEFEQMEQFTGKFGLFTVVKKPVDIDALDREISAAGLNSVF